MLLNTSHIKQHIKFARSFFLRFNSKAFESKQTWKLNAKQCPNDSRMLNRRQGENSEWNLFKTLLLQPKFAVGFGNQPWT